MDGLTIQQFIEKGFKPFREPTRRCDEALQKTYYDGTGKGGPIYFVNVYYTKLNEWEVFSANAQFSRGGLVFNVDLLAADSVEQVEKFYDEIWNDLKCDRYDGQSRI